MAKRQWLDCRLHGQAHKMGHPVQLANGLVIQDCANCLLSRVVGGKERRAEMATQTTYDKDQAIARGVTDA